MIYSFRAECQLDVEGFIATCWKSKINLSFFRIIPSDIRLPDVDVEIESTALIDELLNSMEEVPDGHVMRQTLRPCHLVDNSLERDWTL